MFLGMQDNFFDYINHWTFDHILSLMHNLSVVHSQPGFTSVNNNIQCSDCKLAEIHTS